MNKILKLVLIFVMLFWMRTSFSQCVINPNNTTDGFTPASLPCIDQGVFYDEVIQLYIPTSTVIGGISGTVDSIMLLDITGMPFGIIYASNPSGIAIPGGSNACILFAGITNAPAGTYDLTFYVRVWGTAQTPLGPIAIGPIDTTTNSAGYGYSLAVCGSSGNSCDTVSHIMNGEQLYTYFVDFALPLDSGYLSGNNVFGDKAKAERFATSGSEQLTGAYFYLGHAATTNPSRTVTFRAWDNNGAGGTPGNVLASETVSFNTLLSDVSANNLTYVPFTAQPLITATGIYVGIVLPTLSGDTVALVTNGGSVAGDGWQQYSNNVWHPYTDRWFTSFAHAIYPVLCTPTTGSAPVPNFSAAPLSGCGGFLATQFTDLSINNPTSWSWTFNGGNPSFSSQQNPTVTYNIPGIYSVSLTATNANGSNSITKNSYITVNATVNVTLFKTDATCIQGGTILSQVTGGSGYAYSWNNGATSSSLTNILAGTYSVTVTNSNGCTGIASATVGTSGGISVTLNKTDASCNLANGSITSNVSGGSGYTYSWSNGSTSANLSNLSAGTYSVTVSASNGCSTSSSSVIANGQSGQYYLDTICVSHVVGGQSIITVTDTIPAGSWEIDLITSFNGIAVTDADAYINGNQVYEGFYDPTYSFNQGFYDFQNPPVRTLSQPIVTSSSDLITYSITFNNPFPSSLSLTGCIVLGIRPIGGSLAVTLAKNDAACNQSNGSITSNVSGGSGYTYSWSNGSTSANLTNIPSGSYTVTVTASSGCVATASATVNTSGGISVTLTKADAVCNQANGSITSSASGGSGYTYSWSNGSTSANLNNIPSGTYLVTVTSSNGCTASASATVNSSTGSLAASTSVLISPNCGQSNGSVTVSASGGTPGYTYLWSTVPNQASQTATNISAGSYTVTVTDAGGCSITATANVSNVGGATAVVQSQVNVSCNGGNNGSVTIVATGGTAPYTYSMTGVNFQSSATFSGLTAGSYSFYARDANNCLSTTGAIVTQPNPVTISITKTDINCFGNNTGTATANVSGGTPQYNYTWSNSQSGLLALNLAAGPYTLIITDNNSCTASSGTTITQPAAALSSPVNITAHVSCNGRNDGAAAANPSGGTTPYSYQWSNGQNTSIAPDLIAGTYSITVTDSKGCTSTGSGAVTQPSSLAATTTITNVDCHGANTGKVSLDVSGGTSPYSYHWSDNSSSKDLNVMSAGSYSVTVTDNHGCTIAQPSVVSEPTAITVTTSSVKASSATAQDGSATATVTGGTAPYHYAWSSGNTSAIITGLAAGSYTVTVMDNNNCTATGSVLVDATVGIEDAVTDSGVRLYPNPNTGHFILEFSDDTEREITITDIVGGIILSTSKIEKQKEFELEAEAGIYFLNIKQNRQNRTLIFAITNE